MDYKTLFDIYLAPQLGIKPKKKQSKLFKILKVIIIISILWVVIVLIGGIIKSLNSHDTNSEKTEEKIILTEEQQKEKLNTECSRLRGSSFVKSVNFNNGFVKVEYVKNYKEYKKIKPESGAKQSDYDTYWSTGHAIKKALNDGSVRLMKKLDFVKGVEIIIPYKQKTYSINVEKNQLEKFLNTDIKNIRENWDEVFSNPYVYNKKGREDFFKKFGKVE